ncbi:MAG: hypothetical protein GY869_15315, partial [Planctomycetes bacterium]|nr:hypothetical protein [Planctomycetota bacterium]
KKVGPKYGKDLQAISDMLESGDTAEIAQKVAEGLNVTLQSENKTWELEAQDLVVESDMPETMALSDGEEPKLVLDIEITDALRREGWARDIVRHIQQLRKEIDLEIQNHIKVEFDTEDENLKAACSEYLEYIKAETLCDEMGEVAGLAGESVKQIKIGGLVFKLQVEKTR